MLEIGSNMLVHEMIETSVTHNISLIVIPTGCDICRFDCISCPILESNDWCARLALEDHVLLF